MSRRAVALAGAALLLSGCGQPPAPSSAIPTPSNLASSAVSQADLASWIRFRLTYGLRADLEWVLRVAHDPSAIGHDYRVPLLPDEVERVTQANLSADSLVPAARRYAEEFPAFAGSWLELPLVVLAFTDGLPERRAEVQALFGERVVVRQVRHTLLELEALERTMDADADWFPSIDVDVIDIDVDEMGNVVEMEYRAPTRGVEALIRERFTDTGWLRLDWAGPPPWDGPYGRLEISVVDEDGRPVPVSIYLRPLDPRARDFGPAPLDNGTFIHPAWAAVDWEVDVTYETDGGERMTTREFSVPADGVVRVRIVIDD